ncbi:hypothetical protein C5B85_07875 [Pseudoclavibacter sp. AY1F1]|uniref:hypothetical protein n=1 Tax=Pseudoclavibacter sp. AY1F1 TaxID=2080583 RepID=UPI000CE7A31E|nr:hypothetical protein [Pseudoclavibacter sp. AY1F1]PPF45477.1 hypothetical protein C5B85_07875 [Pseudoclavibacter sp. AY1F1]
MTDLQSPVPVWRRPFHLIRTNLRAYLLVNVFAYGLFIIGFVVGLTFPELNAARSVSLVDDGTAALVQGLVMTPPLFALVILAVNVGKLSLATIVLPSLIVPFAGFAFFGYWAVETGITLAPTTPTAWVQFIPHSFTVVIELQAYVLLLLGAWLLGRHWLSPRTAGTTSRGRAYLRGLGRVGMLGLLAFVLLVIGALWEAYSLRYLLHPLTEWLL